MTAIASATGVFDRAHQLTARAQPPASVQTCRDRPGHLQRHLFASSKPHARGSNVFGCTCVTTLGSPSTATPRSSLRGCRCFLFISTGLLPLITCWSGAFFPPSGELLVPRETCCKRTGCWQPCCAEGWRGRTPGLPIRPRADTVALAKSRREVADTGIAQNPCNLFNTQGTLVQQLACIRHLALPVPGKNRAAELPLKLLVQGLSRPAKVLLQILHSHGFGQVSGEVVANGFDQW